VRFLPLVLANLGRHKRRTVLTILSVALALFLFASLRSVVTTLDATARFGAANRMVVQNAMGIVFPLPMSYAARLGTTPGVEAVTWADWFGGRYGDGKRFFATFAVDPESYFAMYPEIVVPEDQKQAFFRDRGSCIVGRHLLEVFGWKVGQNVTLQGTIFPGDWTFTIRGAYVPSNKLIGEDALIFHYANLDERLGHQMSPGWYVLRIADPALAPDVAKRIDDEFRNSTAATKTGTEQAFQAGFVTMWGNVRFLMNSIGTAVVFAILLVTANAMMMSSRERTSEIAVLKTIGFRDGTLFLLVMVEAGCIAGAGALLGLGGAKLAFAAGDVTFGGFMPGFNVTSGTLVLGAVLALVLTAASGAVPALRAARLPVVQALRKVE
jgi:putative ABC transport system permease protein